MKADHNTIMLFAIKVMLKYKVLSKRERGVIKKSGKARLKYSILDVSPVRCLLTLLRTSRLSLCESLFAMFLTC